MKKVSLLLLTILLTIGCNQKPKEQVVSQEQKPPQPEQKLSKKQKKQY